MALSKRLRQLPISRGVDLSLVSGPSGFAKELGLNWILTQVTRVLSHSIRTKTKRAGVSYSFLFMRADGGQLQEITSLIDSGAIRPVVDRVFPFESTGQALAYVDTGRVRGKVVVKVS